MRKPRLTFDVSVADADDRRITASVSPLPLQIGRYIGLGNSRSLYWYAPDKDEYNFGDWVSPWLYEKIAGVRPRMAIPGGLKRSRVFFAAGSVFPHIRRRDRAIVWGTGIISRADKFPRPARIHAVRGPLSRQRCVELGYDCPEVYGDPGLLLPIFMPMKRNCEFRFGLIPHLIHMTEARRTYGGSPEINIIDVRQSIESVAAEINRCQSIVSSSLHGIIVSQAYGVPVRRGVFEAPLSGDDVKFSDYFLSVGQSPDIPPLRLGDGLSIEELIQESVFMPVPDVRALQDGLLKSCPFPRRRKPLIAEC